MSAALTTIAINYFLKPTGNAAYTEEDQRLFQPAETVNALNQRFEKLLSNESSLAITELVNLIVSKVTDHLGGIQAIDDIAVLSLEIEI
ncbi:MAG: hypothetical protein WA131_05695 [Desulfitobacteriaceae bacterium]